MHPKTIKKWQRKMEHSIMTIMVGMHRRRRDFPDSYNTVAYAMQVIAYEVDKLYPLNIDSYIGGEEE